MKRRLGASLAVLALTAGGMGVAGCGGDSTPAASTAAATAATTAAADNGIASLPASEILGKAVAAAEAASSVHVAGSVPQGTDGSVTIDMSLGDDGTADGSITVEGVEVQLRVTGGTTYVNAPAALFNNKGDDAGAVAESLLGDKWFAVPNTGAVASYFFGIENIVDKDTLLKELLNDSGGEVSLNGQGTVNGQPVVVMTGPKGGTLSVATTGEPYPLQVKAKTGETGQIDMTDWNVPFTVEVPKDLVDLGALEALATSTG